MSSVCYGGSVLMKPEFENENFDPMFDEGYPYKMPKVYLEGWGESYFPQWCFNWDDDSVVVVRDQRVVKYTRSSFVELLAKNEEGEIVWMDGRRAPYSNCWGGEYLDEDRGAQEYTVEEYNLETNKKRKYKVVFDEESKFDILDYHSLSKYVDADKLGAHFKIENGVLLQYEGNDTTLIIPDGVTEIGYRPFWSKKEFESIVIPNTLVKISDSIFEYCKVKEIIVAEDNPKFISKCGCLIDKETGTLVWGYAANAIPCDDSIHKIGPKAFWNREDLENIVIPDNITDIGRYAFHKCKNMKYALMSGAVKQLGEGAFYGCQSLSLVSLSRSLTTIDRNTFCGCSSLETIDVPNSIVTVDSDAFSSCDNLKEIGVPYDSVEIIEKALDAKLIRDGDRWRIERLISPSKKLPRNFAGFEF